MQKSSVEKLFKLINYVVFIKAMENERSHRNMELKQPKQEGIIYYHIQTIKQIKISD